jgi:hypothetical protein
MAHQCKGALGQYRNTLTGQAVRRGLPITGGGGRKTVAVTTSGQQLNGWGFEVARDFIVNLTGAESRPKREGRAKLRTRPQLDRSTAARTAALWQPVRPIAGRHHVAGIHDHHGDPPAQGPRRRPVDGFLAEDRMFLAENNRFCASTGATSVTEESGWPLPERKRK